MHDASFFLKFGFSINNSRHFLIVQTTENKIVNEREKKEKKISEKKSKW